MDASAESDGELRDPTKESVDRMRRPQNVGSDASVGAITQL